MTEINQDPAKDLDEVIIRFARSLQRKCVALNVDVVGSEYERNVVASARERKPQREEKK